LFLNDIYAAKWIGKVATHFVADFRASPRYGLDAGLRFSLHRCKFFKIRRHMDFEPNVPPPLGSEAKIIPTPPRLKFGCAA